MKKENKIQEGKASLVLGLVVNLVIPGLGTIIFGEYETGMIQLIGFIASTLIFFSNLHEIVNMAMVLAVIVIWIWALINGIKVLKKK
jgi:hypothetical protein